MTDGVGEQAFHRLDLAQAGAVEMANARIPQVGQRHRMRIGLHRIKDIAGKTVEELFGGGREFVGMNQI